ncbi:hypothetical protein [Cellulomonas sp. ATA003]|uniref:hypothetical protein n=1 Tax=Cellulomonas sp. ATA003 TaxID=3073064 RepID=UPI0028730D42|nr:hypothetical protein [Cellulomonas sp. ATA003]WNB85826.1 hypothetical protein REH70_00265 [Cellulomonas sp. ATA003]
MTGALSPARALHAAGWFVGIGTPDGGGMPGASRACDARHVVARPRGDSAEFIAGVRAAVTAGGYDVVFGGGDDWMAALATYRDALGTRVAHPPADVAQAALDKVTLAGLADEVGLAAPHTRAATDEVLAAWDGPAVVKCRAHWSPGQTHPHRIDARLFPAAAAARPQVERIRRAGAEPVLQVPVRGDLGALVGVFHDGRLHGRVQQASPGSGRPPTVRRRAPRRSRSTPTSSRGPRRC